MKPQMMMKFEPHQEKNVFDLFIYDTVTREGKFDWSSWTMLESKTSAQYFSNVLAQIPDNAEMRLFINSNGGMVSEGVAIYNQLKRHPAQKTGYVDGCAYSVASLILQACDKRIMGLGTSMLVHNMWVSIDGNAAMLRKMADDLDNWMVANRKVYLERCAGKITEEQLTELMDEEKILNPDNCLAYGFIDEIAENMPEDIGIEQKETNQDGVAPEQIALIQSMQQFIDIRQSLLNNIQQMDVPEPNRTPENKANPCVAFFDHLFK